jgi:hypothetical protein
MGVLLRGAQERFNPQIHTEANSLNTLMKKDFAVARKTFDLFKKYNKFTSWMYYSGRVNQGAQKGKMQQVNKEISDNAYRISYEGMDILPSYGTGNAVFGSYFDGGNPAPDMSANGITYTNGKNATNIETNTVGSIAVKHDPANDIWGDKFNPNDRFNLGSNAGVTAIVLKKGRLASTNDHIVYDVKTIGPAAAFQEAHLGDMQLVARELIVTNGELTILSLLVTRLQ